MKAKHAALVQAFNGRFDDHHGELARILLDQIDSLSRQVDRLTDRIEVLIAAIPAADAPEPCHDTTAAGTSRSDSAAADGVGLPAVQRLTEIPGLSPEVAQQVLAETGLDMGKFPTARASGVLDQAMPSHHPIRIQDRYRRSRPRKSLSTRRFRPSRCSRGQNPNVPRRTLPAAGQRRGKLKALVAVARSILVIIWHLLAGPTTRYRDLGVDYHTNRGSVEHRTRGYIRQLEALGFTVALTPAP